MPHRKCDRPVVVDSPSLAATPEDPRARPDEPFQLCFRATNAPCTPDFDFNVEWGDAQADSVGSGTAGDLVCLNHTYVAEGGFAVVLVATDDTGRRVDRTLNVTSVNCEFDADLDTISDPDDNCVNTDNRDQANADGDPWGDACDNCVFDDNADQADADNDSIGDACDACPAPGEDAANTPPTLICEEHVEIAVDEDCNWSAEPSDFTPASFDDQGHAIDFYTYERMEGHGLQVIEVSVHAVDACGLEAQDRCMSIAVPRDQTDPQITQGVDSHPIGMADE